VCSFFYASNQEEAGKTIDWIYTDTHTHTCKYMYIDVQVDFGGVWRQNGPTSSGYFIGEQERREGEKA
jgi:hypothetical protein